MNLCKIDDFAIIDKDIRTTFTITQANVKPRLKTLIIWLPLFSAVGYKKTGICVLGARTVK